MPIAEEVLTLREAARLLRITAKVLESEAADGRIPGRVIAGEWRFGRSAILAWLTPAAAWPPAAPFGPWSADAEREAEAEIARLTAARRREPKPARSRAE